MLPAPRGTPARSAGCRRHAGKAANVPEINMENWVQIVRIATGHVPAFSCIF